MNMLVDVQHSPGRAAAKMKLGGRVNEASAKKLLAKQLGDFANNLEGVGFLDCKTGRIVGKTLACMWCRVYAPYGVSCDILQPLPVL